MIFLTVTLETLSISFTMLLIEDASSSFLDFSAADDVYQRETLSFVLARSARVVLLVAARATALLLLTVLPWGPPRTCGPSSQWSLKPSTWT